MMTYTSLKNTEKELSGYIRRSANAYGRGDTIKEGYWADKLEAAVKAINGNVTVDWPGLDPCFNVNGFEFYSVDSLLNELFTVTAK